jgi:hypothetical protein
MPSSQELLATSLLTGRSGEPMPPKTLSSHCASSYGRLIHRLHRVEAIDELSPRLKKPVEFSEIRRKPAESGRSEFQNHRIYCSLFQNFKKKDKSQQKICKKN